MPAIFELHREVEHQEIDRQGHASNVAYVAWMQEAALAHSAAQGWPIERYEQMGAGFVVRSHEIKYLQPAYEGDLLIIRTWVADFQRVSSRRRYKIVRATDDALLASAETQWAFVDFGTGALRRIPDQIARDFVLVTD